MIKRISILMVLFVLFVLFVSLNVMADVITLEFRDLFTGPDSEALDEMVAKFNQAYPNIKVNRQKVKWENYYDQLQLSIAGGSAPDVAVVHTRWLPSFAARKALMPLDTYIENSELSEDNFLTRAWKGTFYDGKQYAVPLDVIVAVVTFYNKDIMEETGIEHPPTTKEEFIEMCLTVQENTGKWGTLIPLTGYVTYRNFFTTLHQNGGSIVTDDLSKANFNTAEGREALQFWHDLIYKYEVAPEQISNSIEGFSKGEAAFLLEGIWNSKAFEIQEDLNFGVTTVPVFFEDSSFFGNSHNFVIPTRRNIDQDKMEASMVFMEWMAKNTHDWGQVPSVEEVLTSNEVQNSVRANILDQLSDLVYPPSLVNVGRVEQTVQEAVEAVLTGNKTVEEALAEAEVEVNKVLSK